MRYKITIRRFKYFGHGVIFQVCYFVDYDVGIIYRIYNSVHYDTYPETHIGEVVAKGRCKLLNVFKNVDEVRLTPFFSYLTVVFLYIVIIFYIIYTIILYIHIYNSYS